MTRADLIAAVKAVKPYLSERECLAIVRGVLGVVREPSEGMLRRAFVAMNETPSGTWKRLKAEKASPRRLFDLKQSPRFTAMIDALLGEVGE